MNRLKYKAKWLHIFKILAAIITWSRDTFFSKKQGQIIF